MVLPKHNFVSTFYLNSFAKEFSTFEKGITNEKYKKIEKYKKNKTNDLKLY